MAQPLEHPGRLGVWSRSDGFTIDQSVDFAKKLEDLGYSTWWIPEALGRDPFSFISAVGSRTESLTLATGIANIYVRDLHSIKAIHHTVSEILPGRFILGLGVSHEHLVHKVRGHRWEKPLGKMRSVLEGLDDALYQGPTPEIPAPIVIAALRPKMMELAREFARGAHPYLVTPEHTRSARKILGDGPWLCPEQMVILETDPTKARDLARAHLKIYLRAPNYQNSLLELGFDASDWKDAKASDRLVDALIAWGDADTIRQRLEEHWEAGADHVCIQPFRPDGVPDPDMMAIEALAPRG